MDTPLTQMMNGAQMASSTTITVKSGAYGKVHATTRVNGLVQQK
jgi:hypothetical protein